MKDNIDVSEIALASVTEFLSDFREHPDSFSGIDYRDTVKVLKDISNQSLNGVSVKDHPLFSTTVRAKYKLGIIPLVKLGFKDRHPFPHQLPAVLLELETDSDIVDRIQLAIHASTARPAHLALRVRYKEKKHIGYSIIPCTTSTVVKMYNTICK
jgi:hypothetical protein